MSDGSRGANLQPPTEAGLGNPAEASSSPGRGVEDVIHEEDVHDDGDDQET